MDQYTHHFIRLSDFSTLYAQYAFIDTADYLADDLFIQKQVKAIFGKELGKEGTPYRVVLCKVRKRDEPKFREALMELPNKMLLCGHPDYLNYCDELVKELGFSDARAAK